MLRLFPEKNNYKRLQIIQDDIKTNRERVTQIKLKQSEEKSDSLDAMLASTKKYLAELEQKEEKLILELKNNPQQAALEEKIVLLETEMNRCLAQAHFIIEKTSNSELKEFFEEGGKFHLPLIHRLQREINHQVKELRCKVCGNYTICTMASVFGLFILSLFCPGPFSLHGMNANCWEDDRKLENLKSIQSNIDKVVVLNSQLNQAKNELEQIKKEKEIDQISHEQKRISI